MLGALCAYLLFGIAFAFAYRSLGPRKPIRSSVPPARHH